VKAAEQGLEERLLAGYYHIRNNYRNGLAVVTVERNACGGCFSAVPPQRQSEIKQAKKIIICEHCGRILVDDSINDLAAEG
jgi:predicted  nucleic acid-binding Zn-ribbon protein